MSKKFIPINQLLVSYPSLYNRRKEVISALCRGVSLAGDNWQTKVIGKRIVEVANTIVEEEYNI